MAGLHHQRGKERSSREHFNVCRFAIQIEGELANLESRFDDAAPHLRELGYRFDLDAWAHQIRDLIDQFVLAFDDAILSAGGRHTGSIDPVAVRLVRPPSKEGPVNSMIWDQDARAFLSSILSSGRHDLEKVGEGVDLAVRYVEALDQRRAGGRGPRDRKR